MRSVVADLGVGHQLTEGRQQRAPTVSLVKVRRGAHATARTDRTSQLPDCDGYLGNCDERGGRGGAGFDHPVHGARDANFATLIKIWEAGRGEEEGKKEGKQDVDSRLKISKIGYSVCVYRNEAIFFLFLSGMIIRGDLKFSSVQKIIVHAFRFFFHDFKIFQYRFQSYKIYITLGLFLSRWIELHSVRSRQSKFLIINQG